MELLIVLAILGGLLALYALVLLGIDLAVYLIADIRSFKEYLDIRTEERRTARKIKLEKRKEKKIAQLQAKKEKKENKENKIVENKIENNVEKKVEEVEQIEEIKAEEQIVVE